MTYNTECSEQDLKQRNHSTNIIVTNVLLISRQNSLAVPWSSLAHRCELFGLRCFVKGFEMPTFRRFYMKISIFQPSFKKRLGNARATFSSGNSQLELRNGCPLWTGQVSGALHMPPSLYPISSSLWPRFGCHSSSCWGSVSLQREKRNISYTLPSFKIGKTISGRLKDRQC